MELTEYYEEKKQATVRLSQISSEMIDDFAKAVTEIRPSKFDALLKQYEQEMNTDEGFLMPHWNAEFEHKKLVPLAKELFELRERLPQKGRLKFESLDSNVKDELIKFVDGLIASNEQLQKAVGLYIDSRLNLTEMYTDNIEAYEKASIDYSKEAKKVISNKVLGAIKTLNNKDHELQYKQRMKLAFIKELSFGIFEFLGKEFRANQRGRKSRLVFSTELSEQAKKEKAKELESAGGWDEEHDY